MPASEARRPGVTAIGACCVVALVGAGVARADWKDDYGRGVRAASGGDWAQVEARMRAAMAEEPGPIARARLYGQRFDPYIPRYYLGLAAYRQGRCADAVREWGDAATRAIWSASAELARVANAGLAECQTRLAQAGPAPGGAASAPAPAAGPATGAPDGAARTDAPPARGVPAPAEPVATTRAPGATGNPPPSGAPARAAAPPPGAAAAAPATRAPAALLAALDAYLAGRYEAVVAVDPATLAEPRARAHALLLRAAARHTQAQLRGADGAALLDQAAADVRAARALDAQLSPDPALYSPRFRAFWAQTR